MAESNPVEEKLKPGIYQAVDLKALKQLQEEHSARINESKSRGRIWAKHKDDYNALKLRLSTITDKTQHNVMVPFGGKKAFFEGQLVHTNEIMVLLGDNWFVERSAKEATEICQRRLLRCDEMLEKIDKEIQLYQSWLHEATQLCSDSNNGDGNLEIREPYDENQEKMWREDHRRRVREAKLAEKNAADHEHMSDEAFWRRLDELEIEEELDAHMASSKLEENDNDNEEDDLSESPPITDDEDEIEKKDIEKEPIVQAEINFPPPSQPIQKKSAPEQELRPKSRFKVAHRRAVSFGAVSERLFSREQDGVTSEELLADLINHDTSIIEFESSPTSPNFQALDKVPNNPGQIALLYGQSPVKACSSPSSNTPKKSILRVQSKYGPINENIDESPNVIVAPRVKKMGIKSAKFTVTPSVNAVGDFVVERDPPPMKPSKFTVTPTLNTVSDSVTEREKARTKFTVTPAVKAVNDVVIEREPTFPVAENSTTSQVADATPVTQKFSRFRATRVNQ